MVAATCAGIVDLVLTVFELILLARIIASWLNADPYSPIIQFLYRVTEPVLAPIRRMLPPTGAMDFSPLVAFLIIFVLRVVLSQLIYSVL